MSWILFTFAFSDVWVIIHFLHKFCGQRDMFVCIKDQVDDMDAHMEVEVDLTCVMMYPYKIDVVHDMTN